MKVRDLLADGAALLDSTIIEAAVGNRVEYKEIDAIVDSPRIDDLLFHDAYLGSGCTAGNLSPHACRYACVTDSAWRVLNVSGRPDHQQRKLISSRHGQAHVASRQHSHRLTVFRRLGLDVGR